MTHDIRIRLATLDDCSAIEALIDRSVRALSAGDYSSEQIEAGLQAAWSLDTLLIEDGTCFVAEHAGQIIGCGGWSSRRTLFGGDTFDGREDERLDPATEAGRIRAFFVDPGFVRQGIGRALLRRCEDEAIAAGFSSLELAATLPGVRLYGACGYTAGEPYQYECAPGLTMPITPMRKSLPAAKE